MTDQDEYPMQTGAVMATTPFRWQNLLPAHVQHAREFLSAAEKCESFAGNERVQIFHAPSLFLAAHTVELTLKCVSLWSGKCECSLREDRHRLAGPYNRLKSDRATSGFIRRAEAAVKDNWKAQLHQDRADYLALLRGYEDEVPTNADIGQSLPNLADTIDWLDVLHADDGGALRYVRINSLVGVPVILSFGKTSHVVPQTAFWACRSILYDLDQCLVQADMHNT